MFSKLVKNRENILDVIKATISSLLISTILVLIFALLVKNFSFDEKVIVPVNYSIKIISILLGVLLGFRVKEKGLLKGFFVGILYYFLSIFLFSIFSANFNLIKVSLLDTVSLSLVGILSGIIAVNVKNK